MARPGARFAFIVPGGVALLAGLNSSLSLLSLPPVAQGTNLEDFHGPLMVLGFVGTVICLERAAALNKSAGYAAPALSGAGAIVLVLSGSGFAPAWMGQALLTAAYVALIVLYLPLWRRTRDDAIAIEWAGALSAAVAAGLWWSGVSVPNLIPLLSAFILLTIMGERLELSRIAVIKSAPLMALSTAVLAMAISTLIIPATGYRLLGLTLIALITWLGVNDPATRTRNVPGLPRYMAVLLMTGYAWLLVPASIWLVFGQVTSGTLYDAALHGMFLGFTMSMIFAHAPIIFPAVVPIRMRFTATFYLPAALLYLTLAIRIFIGDVFGITQAVQIGGVGNIVAVLAFVVVIVVHSRLRPTPARKQLHESVA